MGFFRTSLFTFRFPFPYDDNDLNEMSYREGLVAASPRACQAQRQAKSTGESKGGLWQKRE
jgi:hypothetical protein